MKICMISLGCDKNLVDSEMMLGYLRREDVSLTDEQAEADVIIVNTCAFILDAKDESIQTMLSAAQYKEEGNLKALIMAGCMAERYKDEVLREIPEIDAVVGTSAYDKISAVLDRVLDGEKVTEFEDLSRLPAIGTETARVRTSLASYGYLKIAEGCDKHCTYCIIPSLRGGYRSYPMESLVREAERLAEDGIKELILVAQETTRYGMDLYGEKRLPELLRRLCRIDGIQWIRILYCYPEEITDELIEVMAAEKKICHYLDLPIQHASDAVLKRMGRRTSRADLEAVIRKLRTAMPDIALRTTLISGFPGETEEDQESVLSFVEEMRFERLGVFTYSQEEDTPAAGFEGQIDEDIKAARRDEIMELQQAVSRENLQRKVGACLDVFVEGYLSEEDVYMGRTYMDAPDVDGYLFFPANGLELMSGSIVPVLVTEASEYDLKGVLYEDESAE
ncbi:30S ribosomal protein S12 methylthiotransferase RimO [Stomatobaculum longum]|uniref:30S ribosomal protein S12 methylthiotransferase RimO n=1 Tax=Stomatobaculum longum TaxID=796942 RepID=UPI0028E90407|nr:30S ribosomal protein S12 methylthiotransferase RimO [Stomatobaculum longum]